MKNQLRQLGEVSDMILDLKLAGLQGVTRKANAIVEENQKMKQAQVAREVQISQGAAPDVALFNGQDEVWKNWMQEQLKARNVKLANLYAEREEHLADARQAMGRAEVIRKLLKQQG